MDTTPTTDGPQFRSAPEPIERERLPATWITTAIIVVNLAVFAAMVAMGSGIQESSPDILREWGANSGLLVAEGQWWRLLTCAFLHGGILHVGVNMYSLHVVGRPVELFFGRGPYVAIYVLSGIVASMASLLWTPDAFSVGASGAIFGVFGAMAAFFVANRTRMPPALFRSQMTRMVMVLVINLLIGLGIPNIDQAAHVGGLVSGFVIAMVVVRGIRTGRLALHVAGAMVAAIAMTPIVHARLMRDPDVGSEIWRQRAQVAFDAHDWNAVRDASDHLVALGKLSDLGHKLRTFADQQSSPH